MEDITVTLFNEKQATVRLLRRGLMTEAIRFTTANGYDYTDEDADEFLESIANGYKLIEEAKKDEKHFYDTWMKEKETDNE